MMNRYMQLFTIFILVTLLHSCAALSITSSQSSQAPTQENTSISSSTHTFTPSPIPPTATQTATAPPEPPDLAKFGDINKVCPASSAVKLEPGVIFGVLSDVAHDCYGWVSPDVSKEEGLLSHLKIIYKVFDGTTMPERDTLIDQEVEIFINSSPENLDLLGIVLTPTPILIHPKGEVVTHHKNQKTGFEWFSYVPNSMTLNDDVIIVINGFQCCCEQEQIGSTKGWLHDFSHYAEKYKFVFLFPAIPKNCPGESQGLDRWSYHYPKYIFTTNPDYPFYRIDLKLNAMIDELMEILKEDGYDVHPKVFMFGYSIDSLHANRYSLIHPERVEAFAAGGSAGEISLPFDSIDGSPLNWWFGIANIEHLTKKPFNSEAYYDISQFYFWGDQDLANYHLEEGCRYEGGAFCRWYYYWGKDLVTALREQCSFLQDMGLNVVCKEYQGLAHDFYDTMRDDVFKLFDEIRREKLGK